MKQLRWPTDRKIATDAMRSGSVPRSPAARQIIEFAGLAPGLYKETFVKPARFAVKRKGGFISTQRLRSMWAVTICQPDFYNAGRRPLPLIRIKDHWYRLPMVVVHQMRFINTYRTQKDVLLNKNQQRFRRGDRVPFHTPL